MDKITTEKGTKRGNSEESSDETDDDVVYFEEDSLESEHEMECENWDADCRIIDYKCDMSLSGYHLMPTCSRNPDETPRKKVKLAPDLRCTLLETSFKNEFREIWEKNDKLQANGVEIITEPFRVCVINDFLENVEFLSNLREEFNEIEWNIRNMDLYEFFQSPDLKELTHYISLESMYNFLKNDVMQLVAQLTGLNLTHISATCSFYSNSDYLLVHDDQREDRLVAFILYLSPTKWGPHEGGALQLFNKDKIGHPLQVTREIFPTNNQFVFFPVTSDSYHQVAEVTSLSKCRLSINGWFHTKIAPIFDTITYKPYPQGLFGDSLHKPNNFDSDLSLWFATEYLQDDVIKQIQEYFEEHSEISLKNFLKTDCFNALEEILASDGVEWVQIGPPNRHCYQIVNTNSLQADLLTRFLQLCQSKQMFDLLGRYTDLELSTERASMKFELQKWTPGSYSLLGDYGWGDTKELDLIINFGCKSNSEVIGARTQYVAIDEEVEDALITLEPEENNLNLVYRDTARFTKYYSKLSKCQCFYTLICSYSE